MKKVSTVDKNLKKYKVVSYLKGAAVIESLTGETGLMNTKTNEIIGDLGDYMTNIYYNHICTQTKTILNPESKEPAKFLRAYDGLDEKMIFDEYEIIYSYHASIVGLCYILKRPDGKFCVFDKDLYREMPELFDTPFDNIEMFVDKKCYIVIFNGKKGLFKPGKGFILNVEYDEITCDERKSYIYAKKGKTTYIFDLNENMRLITSFENGTIDVHNSYGVTFVEDTDAYYKFPKDEGKNGISKGYAVDIIPQKAGYSYIREGSKYGLIKKAGYDKFEKPVRSLLIASQYDKIEFLTPDFVLCYKNSKCDILFLGSSQSSVSVTYLKEYGQTIFPGNEYSLCASNILDLYRKEIFDTAIAPVLTSCTNFEKVGNAYIFKQNNLFGIMWLNGKTLLLVEILNGYQNIRYLGGNYFECEKSGKRSIIRDGKVIVPMTEAQITVHSDQPNSESLDTIKENVFIISQYPNGQARFTRVEKSTGRSTTIANSEIKGHEKFMDVKFLPNIIVVEFLPMIKRIYNYSGEEITEIIANDISVANPHAKEDEMTIYNVDGKYYIYEADKKSFKETFFNEEELFVTAYESEYGIVSVNSYDEDEHNKICEAIDACGEEKFNKTLINLYRENPSIQRKFSTLLMKK